MKYTNPLFTSEKILFCVKTQLEASLDIRVMINESMHIVYGFYLPENVLAGSYSTLEDALADTETISYCESVVEDYLKEMDDAEEKYRWYQGEAIGYYVPNRNR